MQSPRLPMEPAAVAEVPVEPVPPAAEPVIELEA